VGRCVPFTEKRRGNLIEGRNWEAGEECAHTKFPFPTSFHKTSTGTWWADGVETAGLERLE
jgi:hypothetical protein